MMNPDDTVSGFDQALATMPSCALDAAGRRSQAARYRAIAQWVTQVRREPEVVLVDFGDGVDPGVVEEAIAVERDCCPWLRFEYDPAAGRLAVTATAPAMLPALSAIEAGFAPGLPPA